MKCNYNNQGKDTSQKRSMYNNGNSLSQKFSQKNKCCLKLWDGSLLLFRVPFGLNQNGWRYESKQWVSQLGNKEELWLLALKVNLLPICSLCERNKQIFCKHKFVWIFTQIMKVNWGNMLRDSINRQKKVELTFFFRG